jgi:DNA-binding response OmpR family regulator
MMAERKKILVIDDDPQDLKGMAIVLHKGGYPGVIQVENAAKGLAVAKTIRPDFVIIDVVLGQDDGLDVAREIKKALGLKTKVILVTGHLDAINAKKARLTGADEIVEKNQGFALLLPTIKRLA